MTIIKLAFILISLTLHLLSSPAFAERAMVKVEKIWDTESQLLLQISPPPTSCEDQITPNALIEKSPQNNDSIYTATISKIEDIEVEIIFTPKDECDNEPLFITID